MKYRNLAMVGLGIAAMAGLGTAAPVTQAAQDQIEVAGHIAIGNSPVTRLMATQHYGRYYLDAEYA